MTNKTIRQVKLTIIENGEEFKRKINFNVDLDYLTSRVVEKEIIINIDKKYVFEIIFYKSWIWGHNLWGLRHYNILKENNMKYDLKTYMKKQTKHLWELSHIINENVNILDYYYKTSRTKKGLELNKKIKELENDN